MIGTAAFILLFMASAVDLTRFGIALFNSPRLFTLIYLVLAVTVFFAFRFRLITSMGLAGTLYLATLIINYAAGTIVRVLNPDAANIAILTFFSQVYVAGFLLVGASALGSYHIFRRYGVHKASWIILAVLCLQIPGFVIGSVFRDRIYVNIADKQERLASIGREVGLFGDPNQAGMFLCSAAAVGFSILISKRRSYETPIIYAILAAIAVCVFATFSRSALATLMLLGASQAFISPVLRKRSALIFGLVLLVTLVYVLTQASQSVGKTAEQQRRLSSMLELAQGNFDERVTGTRFVQWGAGIKYWMESPLVGNGFGMGGRIYDRDLGGWRLGAHNNFIRTLYETGVVGLIPYLLSLAVLTWQAFTCQDKAVKNLVLGYLVVYVCSALTLHTMFGDNIPAMMMGVCFAAIVVTRQQAAARRRAVAIERHAQQMAAMNFA